MGIRSIFTKIKASLKNMFGKHKVLMLNSPTNINTEKNITKNAQNVSKMNSVQEMSDKNKKERALKEIIRITEKNPELLYTLDLDKLDIINKYYIEDTKKIRVRNTQLKKEIRCMQKKLENINRMRQGDVETF